MKVKTIKCGEEVDIPSDNVREVITPEDSQYYAVFLSWIRQEMTTRHAKDGTMGYLDTDPDSEQGININTALKKTWSNLTEPQRRAAGNLIIELAAERVGGVPAAFKFMVGNGDN